MEGGKSGLSLITVLLCQCQGNKVRSEGRTEGASKRTTDTATAPAAGVVHLFGRSAGLLPSLVVILYYLDSFCPRYGSAAPSTLHGHTTGNIFYRRHCEYETRNLQGSFPY